MYEINGKVILVTGGAAGIGAGAVRAFVEEGAKHVAILDLDEENGNTLELDLAAKYGRETVKFYNCDVTTDDLDKAFDDVVYRFGYIDVVINNAGILNDSPNVYVKSIQVNVIALINSSFKAYELMRKDRNGKGGTIINISSIAALGRSCSLPVYSATKSAVLQFSQCLGMEPTYSRTGVRVLITCFGCTNTSLLHDSKYGVFDPEVLEPLKQYFDKSIKQKLESAVRGMLEMYKNADSASIWLIMADEPAQDITAHVSKAYTNNKSSG